MNFEPMSRVVTSLFFFFDQSNTVFWESWGVRGPISYQLHAIKTSWRCQKDVHFLGKSTFEHKVTKSGHRLLSWENNWGKARFLGFLIKVLLSVYRGGMDSAFQRHGIMEAGLLYLTS